MDINIAIDIAIESPTLKTDNGLIILLPIILNSKKKFAAAMTICKAGNHGRPAQK